MDLSSFAFSPTVLPEKSVQILDASDNQQNGIFGDALQRILEASINELFGRFARIHDASIDDCTFAFPCSADFF